MTIATRTVVTRQEVEDFLYREAALLDEWKLEEWQALLADDATYYVPAHDQPEGSHRNTPFLRAGDGARGSRGLGRVPPPLAGGGGGGGWFRTRNLPSPPSLSLPRKGEGTMRPCSWHRQTCICVPRR